MEEEDLQEVQLPAEVLVAVVQLLVGGTPSVRGAGQINTTWSPCK